MSLTLKQKVIDNIIKDLEENPNYWDMDSANSILRIINGEVFIISFGVMDYVKTMDGRRIAEDIFNDLNISHRSDLRQQDIPLNLYEPQNLRLAELAKSIYANRKKEFDKRLQKDIDKNFSVWE
jgi:hypothetical protein